VPGVAIGLLWVGYWLTYYGLTQIQGGNWGLFDLGLPGRYTPQVALTPRDAKAGDTGNPVADQAKAKLSRGNLG
jgi:hypothetical protein